MFASPKADVQISRNWVKLRSANGQMQKLAWELCLVFCGRAVVPMASEIANAATHIDFMQGMQYGQNARITKKEIRLPKLTIIGKFRERC
jgi:hypothetical protein